MAECGGARYWEWVNANPEDAFFKSDKYPEHPQANVTPPMSRSGPNVNALWVYQDTRVDIESLDKVVREAFALAGVPLRGNGALREVQPGVLLGGNGCDARFQRTAHSNGTFANESFDLAMYQLATWHLSPASIVAGCMGLFAGLAAGRCLYFLGDRAVR
jgi:hypothetical protein